MVWGKEYGLRYKWLRGPIRSPMFGHQTKILVVLVAVRFKKASKAYSFVDVMRLEAQSISQPILAFLLAVVWVSV